MASAGHGPGTKSRRAGRLVGMSEARPAMREPRIAMREPANGLGGLRGGAYSPSLITLVVSRITSQVMPCTRLRIMPRNLLQIKPPQGREEDPDRPRCGR